MSLSRTTIPTAPEEGVDVRAKQQEMFAQPPVLEAGADLSPALPHTGGVPGTWVSAAPAGSPSATEAGVLLYVHGGGFSYSNPPMERIMAHRFSQATGRPALAVDYRLAPAHPFPAAVEDVAAAYRALLAQGVPAGRVLLAGESAGGTLVLSALLVLAEAGDRLPAGAVVVSPVTDFAADDSTRQGGDDVIDASIMGGIDEQYLAGARPDQAPQSPIHGDLAGLPPLLLAAGGDEILLGDARRFAEAASAAGVRVELDVYERMPHAFHAAVLFPVGARPATADTFLGRVAAWSARVGDATRHVRQEP